MKTKQTAHWNHSVSCYHKAHIERSWAMYMGW